ncbi:MspI family type II restriction endonuclease [Mycoplasma sp. 5912]
MSFSNKDKSKHGYNAQKSIIDLLNFCKNNNYIKSFRVNYRIGKEGYINNEQFYAPFIIKFLDDKEWIIFSTTSMRSDRIKGQQWDAFNIKEINKQVEKAFLIYSDDVDEKESFLFARQNNKYILKEEVTAINEILNQSNLYKQIEQKALFDYNDGFKKNMQGLTFEKIISLILSNSDNLKKYKEKDKTITGLNYPYFYKIISKIDIKPEEIKFIDATSNESEIGKLPSGGKPKTDIILKINKLNNESIILTINCKRTSAKNVTVHEYKAESFVSVLSPQNKELKNLLQIFQENPTLSSFGEDNKRRLTSILKPLKEKLAKWVIGGVCGNGFLNKQWSSHILTFDNNTSMIYFYTIDEYIDLLDKHNICGHFGTHFLWTYPSKKKGKAIQLKCKIISEI